MASRTVSAPLAQLPNALTIARLALIPVYVVLILTCDNGRSWAAALAFGIAGVTDQIDGFIPTATLIGLYVGWREGHLGAPKRNLRAQQP